MALAAAEYVNLALQEPVCVPNSAGLVDSCESFLPGLGGLDGHDDGSRQEGRHCCGVGPGCFGRQGLARSHGCCKGRARSKCLEHPRRARRRCGVAAATSAASGVVHGRGRDEVGARKKARSEQGRRPAPVVGGPHHGSRRGRRGRLGEAAARRARGERPVVAVPLVAGARGLAGLVGALGLLLGGHHVGVVQARDGLPAAVHAAEGHRGRGRSRGKMNSEHEASEHTPAASQTGAHRRWKFILYHSLTLPLTMTKNT